MKMLKKLVSPEIIPSLELSLVYTRDDCLGFVYKSRGQNRALEIPHGLRIMETVRKKTGFPFTPIPLVLEPWVYRQAQLAIEKTGFLEVVLEGQEEAAMDSFFREQVWRRKETGVTSLAEYLSLKDSEARGSIAQQIQKERDLRKVTIGVTRRMSRLNNERAHDSFKVDVASTLIDSPSNIGMPEGVQEIYEETPLHNRLWRCAKTPLEWESGRVEFNEMTKCDVIAYYSPQDLWVIEVKTGGKASSNRANAQLKRQAEFIRHNFGVMPRMMFLHTNKDGMLFYKEVKPDQSEVDPDYNPQ